MPDERAIASAAAALAAGEVVAFPTETVYGLGADATNAGAIARVFALKGRPADHPLIVHVAEPGALEAWASAIPARAKTLAARFWPGPLTLILARAARVPDAVTGGQDTVGIRCPSHPVAQALLRAFARIGSGAVAAPSANKFGHVSPTTAQHVRDEFGADLRVLDGGACEVGLESTIVDLSRGSAVLLRPGGIARDAIEQVLGERLQEPDAQAPRASGTLAAHYAPRTALVLVGSAELPLEFELPANVAVLALREPQGDVRVTSWITAPSDPARYGHDLYANLRTLDASGAKRIVVEAPPRLPAWEAVNDRLVRAAAGSTGELDDEP
jgi:L-threonylcarbamoyladenylate synthase